MATLLDNKERSRNAAEKNYDKKVANGYTSAGLDQLESFANDPKNHENIAEAEDAGNASSKNGFYNPDAGGDSFKGEGGGIKAVISGGVKKKGPMALIISLALGGGIVGFTGPAIGLVHFKEVLGSSFNDQLAAMDRRSDHVLRTRLKGMTNGVCTGVRIMCRFSSMNGRQIKRLEKAGFKITQGERNIFGRRTVVGIETPDGQKFGKGEAGKFSKHVKSDFSTRRAFNRAYSAKFVGFADAKFKKVLSKLKTNKASKLKSTTKEGMDSDLDSSTRGLDVDLEVETRPMNLDADGNYVDENGNVHPPDSDEFKQAKAATDTDLKTNIEAKASTGGSALKSIGKGALKSVSIIGYLDTACTIYNTGRAIAASAKIIRAMQLAQFAMVFLSTTDKIKAGEATPEEVEYMGNMLSEIDLEENVVDESLSSVNNEGEYSTIKNPFYGKNAYDSPGYKLAAYGDVSTLTSRSQQYMVGGGFAGSMGGLMDDVVGLLGGRGAVRNTCKTVQHPLTRISSLAVGLLVSAGSFGLGTVAMAGLSLSLSLAQPFIEAYLADLVAGKVVGSSTRGVEAGDAITVGSTVLMGQAAQARGMKPLTGDELEAYLDVSREVAAEYDAQGRYEAKDTPFDVMNQYSFLGSLARTYYPFISNKLSSIATFVSSIPRSVFSPIYQTANIVKASSFNPDRFNKCKDEGYEELGIAADIFCNVRYGLSNEELSLDTEEVVNYMIQNNYIDSETGEAVDGSDYASFLNNCVDRVDGLGETTVEGGDIGMGCMETSDQKSMFRVYTMDFSINDAMDEESENSTSSASGSYSGGSGGVGDASGLSNSSSSSIAKLIQDNPNVTDGTGQISQIVNGTRTDVSQKLLSVIATVGKNNTFKISSMKRTGIVNGNTKSLHLLGQAVDLSGQAGINGVTITSYTSYSSVVESFIIEATRTALSVKTSFCEIGVPNNTYVSRVINALDTSGCTIFVDLGTGPHIHIGVR